MSNVWCGDDLLAALDSGGSDIVPPREKTINSILEALGGRHVLLQSGWVDDSASALLIFPLFLFAIDSGLGLRVWNLKSKVSEDPVLVGSPGVGDQKFGGLTPRSL